MNKTIRLALESVALYSEESARGLRAALDSIGALNSNIPETVGREALIEVIGPALYNHPANSDYAFTALHHKGDDYSSVFADKVAPTLCNLFLFQTEGVYERT